MGFRPQLAGYLAKKAADRNAEKSTYGRDREVYGGDEDAPLDAWIDCVSTWVERYRFEPYPAGTHGEMVIEFLDGAVCSYPNTPNADFFDLHNSSSKGMWVYYQCKLKDRPYKEVRKAFKTVTAAKKAAREPYGKYKLPRR